MEVFRSPIRSVCEERALVLTAVGVASAIHFDGTEFTVQVDDTDAPAALLQLAQYARETRASPAPPPPMRFHDNAWVGSVLYALSLLWIAYVISNGLWRLDTFAIGELDAARVQSGQWWRAWTALSLHVDVAHLAGNLGAGVWIGYLAARQIGAGTSWLLIVTGAALANLLEALLGPSAHLSVGASTAIFTALGLLCAHSWRTRAHLPQRWARRWGPLIAGVILLGWLGSSGENTDLVAHVLGFLVGVLFGVLVALPGVGRSVDRVPQWLSGLGALGSVALAWCLALARG